MNARISTLGQTALAALLLLRLAPGPLAAQANGEPIAIGTTETIRSEILGEERRVLVYLPDGYETNFSARYPVLYMLDGDAHFHHVTGIIDNLAAVLHIPPMIVVGIANTDRVRDLTPEVENTTFTIPDPITGDTVRPSMPTAGGADAFLRFLTEELAPHIESEYRTAPFRLLMGHSLGGLFTVQALTTQPESFQAYLAISPSLGWDDRAIIRKSRTGLAALPLDGRFLYLTVGELELEDMIGDLRAFTTALEIADVEGLRWWYRVMPDESHPSVVHRSVYDGLEAIFSDYRISELQLSLGDPEAIESHFAAVSEAYGYPLGVPEQILNIMGYMQLEMRQQVDQAVAIFRRNIELYPNSANVYDSLADALEVAGQLDEAAENRDIAVRRAEEIGDERLELFRSKREALRARLATAGG